MRWAAALALFLVGCAVLTTAFWPTEALLALALFVLRVNLFVVGAFVALVACFFAYYTIMEREWRRGVNEPDAP